MKITELETMVVKIPFTHGGPPTGFGGGAWSTIDTLLVRVGTDEGLSGYGEGFGFGMLPATKAAVDGALRGLVLGQDSSQIRALTASAERTLHIFGRSGPAAYAVSGLDIALWDLAGKRAGLPIHQLLGGAGRREVPAYASLFRLSSPEIVASETAAAVQAGYTEVKLHEIAVANVLAAREVLGEGPPLMVDVNCEWDPAEAVATARALRPAQLTWLEEPVWPPESYDALARVAADSGVPVAAGENATTLHDFQALATTARCAYLQPSVTKMGGITGFCRVAELAAAAGVRVGPHSPYFGPGLLATLHLASVFPGVRSVEYLFAQLERPMFGAVGVPDAAGMLAIPGGPGLGADPDPDVMDDYRVA